MAARKRKSKFKGVSFHKGSGRWQAQITMAKLGMKSMHLGYFPTEELAAEAFDEQKRAYVSRLAAKYKLRQYE